MLGRRHAIPWLAASVAAVTWTAWSCTSPPTLPATAAPGEPLPGLSDAERGRFLLGRALFERLATPEEGLGPLFNAERCSSCHDAPAIGGGGSRVPVLKASRFEDGRCSILEERGGDNIQQRATPGLLALGGGAERIPPEATASRHVTSPPLFGLGLLEAVPEAEVARLADPDDADGDGVSGRIPRLPDGRLARFGRKGDAATVRDFVVSALRFELGFTTAEHPREEARNGEPVPAGADPMPDPEMESGAVALLTDYVRFLAPPAPAEPASRPQADSLREGAALFERVGCARCHTPSLRTGPSAEAALSKRSIAPYSDLLLHDLGYGEADVCTPQAFPGEYRTAPLWGLRYRSRYLHDGSEGTLPEAIARHGGEAASAVRDFTALADPDRALLMRFLSSL